MVDTVIFDWHGTLAHWPDEGSNYKTVLAGLGFEISQDLVDGYHSRWDGVDHSEHSLSRDHYLAWTRTKLVSFVSDCGIPTDARDHVIEALIESDFATPMVTFPEVDAVLAELKQRRYSIGICSNWGWDLDPFLRSTGVASYIDVAVTSAQMGCRKPHPAIYEFTLARLGARAAETMFVGDSWEPDVIGPLAAGMQAVHISRRGTGPLPDVPLGASRVDNLRALLDEGVLPAAT